MRMQFKPSKDLRFKFRIFVPMRFISFILAIYFLGLATISCSDKDGCTQGSKNATSYFQTSDCQDAQHANEMCSPLCMCHCCGGVTIVSAEKFHIKENLSSRNPILYTENKITSPSFSIWQPPKV